MNRIGIFNLFYLFFTAFLCQFAASFISTWLENYKSTEGIRFVEHLCFVCGLFLRVFQSPLFAIFSHTHAKVKPKNGFANVECCFYWFASVSLYRRIVNEFRLRFRFEMNFNFVVFSLLNSLHSHSAHTRLNAIVETQCETILKKNIISKCCTVTANDRMPVNGNMKILYIAQLNNWNSRCRTAKEQTILSPLLLSMYDFILHKWAPRVCGCWLQDKTHWTWAFVA